jgi:hypothetical protein
MNDFNREFQIAATQKEGQAQYVTPVVRVMTEAEVLSAFQVNATTASMGWWNC